MTRPCRRGILGQGFPSGGAYQSLGCRGGESRRCFPHPVGDSFQIGNIHSKCWHSSKGCCRIAGELLTCLGRSGISWLCCCSGTWNNKEKNRQTRGLSKLTYRPQPAPCHCGCRRRGLRWSSSSTEQPHISTGAPLLHSALSRLVLIKAGIS